MSVSQTQFTAAVLNPELKTPEGLVNPDGIPAGKRFDVYRNNVAVSLSDALEAAFPAVRSLVGAEFFRAMSGVFLRQHPPTCPMMMFYGTDMPAFLTGFPPVATLPYLPDVATLELAQRTTYHGADSVPIDATKLEQIAPDQLGNTRFTLAPTLQIVPSEWPLFDIYLKATQPNAPAGAQLPQSVLVMRPEFDPVLHPLSGQQTRFITHLKLGDTLEAALAAAGDDFDLTPTLGLLLSQNVITDLT